MKISIITATFNSESTILESIKSLESQTYSEIEYIVIDGASSDNTVSIVNQNASRLSQIVSEPDAGIYDALNKGLALATGDAVGFLHSDDVFASDDAIRKLVDLFYTSKADAVYADLHYVAKHDVTKTVRFWKSGEFDISKLKTGWMPPHPTFFMKTRLYREYGSFDLNFKIAADYDSILRYLWVHKVKMAYLPEVVTLMRVGGASNQSIKNLLLKTKEDYMALKKNNLGCVKALVGKNLSKIPQFFTD
ncbi:glycosyltransferase family 2 protein [Agarivorans albus]|uniref:Colanic acid biosynthesis glycosyl transferase WcaE n=1 Tax=Agarivorans albus MKT 106 TaxID=1331007 RepID=R9PTP0_AGAAL|nr:glycosyltransferase family 2 protein [Agarivorans albus]GAD02756.1 colanic acid biosynthesis glycosyl transferase WcaE [Agarivorans albus MKT 106]